MRRNDPPPIAHWILEHLAAGDRDEALAGDLVEEFRAGRSEGWYWRQTLTACLVSWGAALQARVPLIFFSLAWSMLAPAWQLLCERVSDSRIATNLPNMIQPTFGPLWLIPALVGWTVLHAGFVWIGVLVYSAAQGTLGPPLRGVKVRRGLILAAIVLDVLYPVAVLLGAVYGIAGQQFSATAMGRITDVRQFADLIRAPYFIALLSALWGAVMTSPRLGDPLTTDDLAPRTPSAAHFVLLLAVAGSMNALLFGFLLCRLTTFHAASVTSLLIRAAACVAFSVLGGAGGTWLYWKSPWSPYRGNAPFSLAFFVLVCASAWTWAPASAFLSDQRTAAMAIPAAIGSYLLIAGLRHAAPLLLPDLEAAQSVSAQERSLFSDTLASPRFELHGYVIAVVLYAGCAAIFCKASITAALLVSLGAAIFAWKRTPSPLDPCDQRRGRIGRLAIRLAVASLAAVLVTAWALLDEIGHRAQIVLASADSATSDKDQGDTGPENPTANSGHRGVGYESLILYPFPEKRAIVPPIVLRPSLLAPGTTTPVTIRFTGTYRYVQPPTKHPGPHAHHAHGTPLNVDVGSNNFIPLVMDAHQELAAPIQTERCSAIQVDIRNFDNLAGPVSLALLMSNGSSGSARTLYLGQQPILSTQIGHFSFKTHPVFETISFSVPPQASLRKFEEITVVVLPEVEHSFAAPKIAIEAFRLFPR